MSNNYSKQLSTEQITQKLNKLHYQFEDHYWNDFAQQHQGSRMQAVKMQAKFNPKFLAIPAGLIIIASIVYFSINNMRSENAAKEQIVTNEEQIVPEVKKPIVEPKKDVAVVKKDTVIEQIKPAVTPVPKVEVVVAKVKPKIDNSVTSVNIPEKETKNEVVEVKQTKKEENTVGKKKKKRRKNSSITSGDAFTPTAEEDNIVIPEN